MADEILSGLSPEVKAKLDEQQQMLIDSHLRFVLEANKRVNLTAITDYQTAQLLHVEDCLAALPEINAAPEGELIDLGSGGGYPGLPLAIATGRECVLIESIKKKAAVIREFIAKETALANIRVADVRIEEFSRENSGRAAVVTARALSSLDVLLEYAAPILCLGGQLVAYKGIVETTEVARAEEAAGLTGMCVQRKREYCLSDGTTRREIYVYQKAGEPKISLPRAPGRATKRPLGLYSNCRGA